MYSADKESTEALFTMSWAFFTADKGRRGPGDIEVAVSDSVESDIEKTKGDAESKREINGSEEVVSTGARSSRHVVLSIWRDDETRV